MSRWPWNAYVGQRVVQIGVMLWIDYRTGEEFSGPQYNDVATISKIAVRPYGLAFSLSEWGVNYYMASNFRPVQTRDPSKTVAEIKRIALGVRQPEGVNE